MDNINLSKEEEKAILEFHQYCQEQGLNYGFNKRQCQNLVEKLGKCEEEPSLSMNLALDLYLRDPFIYVRLLKKLRLPFLTALNYSQRKGDWDLLSESLRDSMLYAYLFEGMPLRELDENYLLLDSSKTKGFDSHRVLHHMGVTGIFRGIFAELSLSEGLELLQIAGEEYLPLYEALSRFAYSMYKNEIYSENDNLETKIRTSTGYAYFTTRYEHSPYLRKLAMDAHGLRCMACGFNFEEVYGELGKDFIEVHHCVPLPDLRQEMIVDPEKDLLCLCSNCHRMIHRNPSSMLRVDELREILEEERKKKSLRESSLL